MLTFAYRRFNRSASNELFSPIHTPTRDRSTDNLSDGNRPFGRATSPPASIHQRRGGTITPVKTPPYKQGGAADPADSIKSPLRTPSRSSTTRSHRSSSINKDLKLTTTTSGLAPETTVTPPTPTSPHRGISGNRSGSISNTPSKLSQSMTPLTPTAEATLTQAGQPMSGVDLVGPVTTTIGGQGTSEKSGGSQTGNVAGGFFQSMINAAQSAAQNAATTLSNTVASNMVKGDSRTGSGSNTPDNGRSRSGTETDAKPKGSGESTRDGGIDGSQPDSRKEDQPKKKLAVETLGQGELSLNSLGLHPNGSKADVNKSGAPATLTAANAGETSEVDASAAGSRALGTSDEGSRAGGSQAETITLDTSAQRLPSNIILPPKTPTAEDSAFNELPAYENTTPNAEEREEWIPSSTAGDSLKRSGSSRSNRGGSVLGQARRHRGSSVASSLGNHLIPSTPAQPPASPSGSGHGPKITGFAVASKKRNRDFHALFRSVPEVDYLIEDYGCALQKDILLHGRLYVSEGHICFNSNILGWVNTLVISFDEVMAIEKKSTVLLFPNAIVIQTLHARNVFASFISRDTAYDLLVNIWRISHPGLIASSTGYTLAKQPDSQVSGPVEAGANDVPHSGSDSEDEYDEDEEGYVEEDEEGDEEVEQESVTDDQANGGYRELSGGGGSAPNGAAMNAIPFSAGTRQDATGGGGDGVAAAPASTAGGVDGAKPQDFPGPATHAVTDCGDHDLHYDRIVCDEYLPGPLGKVYALLFGSQSYSFLTKFLEDQKVMELSIPNNAEWTSSSEGGGKSTRGYSYIRPLPGGIGPKQTKCICTEQLEQMDLEKAVSVLVTTQTPDVPSGSIFCVKTRYCLTWGDGSITGSAAETRLQLNCTIEWSGKSWLKGPIEKGCNDGQTTHGKDLAAALKRELEKSAASSASKARVKGVKGGKKRGGAKGAQTAGSAPSAAAQKAAREKAAREKEERENAAWGIFVPLKPILAPVVEMVPREVGLLFGVGALLLIILALAGKLPFVGGRNKTRAWGNKGDMMGFRAGYGDPQSWEQSWHAEEENLWGWLEDRVGLSSARMGASPQTTQEERRAHAWNKLGKLEKNWMLNKIVEAGGMADREVEEAVKVIERRLEVLKAIVNERRRESGHESIRSQDQGNSDGGSMGI